MLAHLLKKLTNLNIFKNNSSNDVFKNMAILATGVGGAQIISISATPILTRIYTPENFGILGIFMAVVGLIVPFSTMRYSVAIPLLKKDGVAINLFIVTLVILFIVTLFTILIVAFFANSIFNLFSISSLISYWWLLPIAVFGSGLYEILNSWSIRQKNFKAIAKTKVIQTLSAAFMKVILGLLETKSLGLLLSSVLSTIIASFLLVTSNYRSLKINIKYINFKRIKFLLQRYVEYPKYRLPSQFILVLSIQLPLLFLATFFGTDIVGYFGLTMMVLSVPLSLFGTTTGQAYYAEVAKIGRKEPEQIYELTKDVIKKLFIFSIVPFLILLFFSPWLFSVVFGENWQEAGVYASILSIYMLTSFISAPLANALNVFENQLLFLKLNITRLILLVIIFFISWFMDFTAVNTIFIYSIGMSAYFVYVGYYILKTIKNHIKV